MQMTSSWRNCRWAAVPMFCRKGLSEFDAKTDPDIRGVMLSLFLCGEEDF
jgi:hypothetical protein